jgi:SagB-type dehydrogenase family enzyme
MSTHPHELSRSLIAAGLAVLFMLGCSEGGTRDGTETTGGQGVHIRLPEPRPGGLRFEEALRKRRSVREYSGRPVSMGELSQILFAAQGITGESHGRKLRTAPSAGALYPMEIYVIAHTVKGLEPGIYHYDPFGHVLELRESGDMRRALSGAGLGQSALREAAFVIACAAVPGRTTAKYGERGYRYVLIETGHVGQNVLLQAVSLGLAAVPIGAFNDAELGRLLGIDGKREAALYLIAVGAPE